MPLYRWECEHCKASVEIIRGFDGHRDPPTKEEEGAPCTADAHAWEKRIGIPLVTKSPGWGSGKKGSW